MAVPLSAVAQQPSSSASTASPYVLHVYENLVQVPALILNQNQNPVRSLHKREIDISLDSGPTFHPQHMHLAGNEPLSLAVLIDTSGNKQWDITSLRQSFARMAKHSLSPSDQVSVYALDCALVSAGKTLPATPATLDASLTSALSSPALHNGGHKPTCGPSVALWDAAAAVVGQLAQRHGRKVLLMLSQGDDRASHNNWNLLRLFAAEKHVAIFGVREPVPVVVPDITLPRIPDATDSTLTDPPPDLNIDWASATEDPYVQLAQGTGGVVLSTRYTHLDQALEKVAVMVRSRYILEFHEPANTPPGAHSIQVTVPSQHDFVTTAGVTITPLSAAIAGSRSTIPTSPSPATFGTRKPLSPLNLPNSPR